MSANHAELETFSRDILNLNRDLETMVMERTMAEMALGVADGIRNPICVIGGFSRLLLKRLTPDDPTREWLTTIAAETKRMEEMVSKFESLAEKREYFFGQEDLNQVVDTTVTMLAPEIEAKEIQLQISIWPEPLIGKINGHLLRVALSHLMRNAIEATPRGRQHFPDHKTGRRIGPPETSGHRPGYATGGGGTGFYTVLYHKDWRLRSWSGICATNRRRTPGQYQESRVKWAEAPRSLSICRNALCRRRGRIFGRCHNFWRVAFEQPRQSARSSHGKFYFL